ncbi:hypothetical protein MKW98_024813 [Papaver atlanticum]|uniref:Uncharacterized protein n=1 Tax=Papaver atlanticum TaxID=357466 RepID=A0AAD4T757_9MAGN|nr:hypothetical protein MKW98_024813 [Papaver atlanticum]
MSYVNSSSGGVVSWGWGFTLIKSTTNIVEANRCLVKEFHRALIIHWMNHIGQTDNLRVNQPSVLSFSLSLKDTSCRIVNCASSPYYPFCCHFKNSFSVKWNNNSYLFTPLHMGLESRFLRFNGGHFTPTGYGRLPTSLSPYLHVRLTFAFRCSLNFSTNMTNIPTWALLVPVDA